MAADVPPTTVRTTLPETGTATTVLAIIAGWLVLTGGVCAFLAGSRKGDS